MVLLASCLQLLPISSDVAGLCARTYLLYGEAATLLALCSINFYTQELQQSSFRAQLQCAEATYLTILAVLVVFFCYEKCIGTAVDTPHVETLGRLGFLNASLVELSLAQSTLRGRRSRSVDKPWRRVW
jgi:hypothetical protein